MSSGVLVHEWIEPTGGAEKVLAAMVDAFPTADVLCLWSDVADPFPGRRVDETWLAKTPLRRSKALALPAMMAAWRHRPGNYDWAVVSSHAFAHQVDFAKAPADFRKYVYVHSPARYLWAPEVDARSTSPLVKLAAPPLKAIDRRRAREITSVMANSQFVADRVERAWQRPAGVMYPPVDVTRLVGRDWVAELDGADRVTFEQLPAEFVLGASRFVAYKRLDAVITAGETAGLPVVIAGRGPLEQELRHRAEQARVPVHFVISPSDALLSALLAAAATFVFLAIEDFGIMPVEAMAVGTPVVSLNFGGVSESVVDGVTGAQVESADDAPGLAAAVTRAIGMDPQACVERSLAFSGERFVKELQDWVKP